MSAATVGMAGLDARSAVGLDELNDAAALQTRVDRKYVVDEHLASRLLESLHAGVRVLEMSGRRSFTYDSVYFDTPTLESYMLAARGRRRRYKIRTRTYVDSRSSFLEVKTEGARAATVKERLPCQPADSHRLTPEGLAYINETLSSSIGMVPSGPLSPVLETHYDRITLYLPSAGISAGTLEGAEKVETVG